MISFICNKILFLAWPVNFFQDGSNHFWASVVGRRFSNIPTTPSPECKVQRKLTPSNRSAMRFTSISIVFLLLTLTTFGQSRPIKGKVIGENLEVISQVTIQDSNTVLLGMTDIDGKFKIEIPVNITTLFIGRFGYEWALITLPTNCDHLDIILMARSSFDFITVRKVNRLRLERFKKLSDLHLTAYKKGIFLADKTCYKQTFTPIK